MSTSNASSKKEGRGCGIILQLNLNAIVSATFAKSLFSRIGGL